MASRTAAAFEIRQPKRRIEASTSTRNSLHVLAVPFPIIGLVGVLLTDMAFMLTGNHLWASASQWLLGMGLGTGIAAAMFGVIDFASVRVVRNRIGWLHAFGNVLALAFSAINLITRVGDSMPIVTPAQFALSSLVVVGLAATGWMGAEMIFRQQLNAMRTMGVLYPDTRF